MCMLCSFCLLWSAAGYTQSRITGVVKDHNNHPLQAATILLLRASDSSLVKGSVTQQGGQYRFDNLSILMALGFKLVPPKQPKKQNKIAAR